MPTLPAQPDPRRRSKALVALVVAVLVVVVALSQRQFMYQAYDWWRLYNYRPSADVVALADVTGMTTTGRHDFYVNHPSIEGKESFNSHCPDNGGEQTIVLGCYIPPQRGIYIYNVNDPQLNGVKEVTAAHEMLHAAYDRLSSSDRKKVDAMLQDYYQHDLHDQRLIDTFAAYQKTEPNDVTNEMHSILGTEVAKLPADLENYYKRYFNDRQVVTSLAVQYQSAFTTRQAQIADYDRQLKVLKQQINDNETSLDSQAEALNSKRQQLDRLLSSGNPSAYNAQVDSFNADVAAYNSLLEATKAKITEYNDIVAKRNAIAVETQNLSQELNSRFQTQSTQ